MITTPGHRLVVLGRDCSAIADRIRAARPDLEVVARTFDDVETHDLERAQMLLAFRIPQRVAQAASHLTWIQSTGAGVDGLLGSNAIAEHTLVTRVLGVFGEPMSEYVLLRCLAIAQDVDRQRRAQTRAEWDVFYPRLLSELHVVVLGVGEIGAAVACTLSRLGARVSGVNRSGRPVDGIACVVASDRLHEELATADVLALVLPNTADTRRFVGPREFAAMKPGAWLVNVSRGSCVDEPALIDALRSGRLGGAALDVFETEPLPADSPLWRCENVWISPHISGLTKPEQAATAFLDNLARLERGESPLGLVDRARGY
jgi:glyoxylate/hydroxypyruvate reductase